MDWPVFAVQWLHVLFAILWFGNTLSLATITIPAINRLPLVRQQEIGRSWVSAVPGSSISLPLL